MLPSVPRLPLPTDDWPRAIGYVRVSRDKQYDKGWSVSTQDGGIKEYCEKNKFFLIETCSDSASGGDRNRPGLARALELVKLGMHFVVADIDRLCRDTKKAEDIYDRFKRECIVLHAVNHDIDWMCPNGKLMFTVLCGLHERQRESVKEKVTENLAKINREGKLRRKAPFGYKYLHKCKDMVPDELQQQTIREIIRMYNDTFTLSNIAHELNRLKNKSLGVFKSGPQKGHYKMFYPETITAILVDAGVMIGKGKFSGRKPLSERIICHRRDKVSIDAPNPTD